MKKYFGYTIIIVAVVTLAVWTISTYIQPALSSNTNSRLVLFFVIFLAIAGVLANMKDITELLRSLFESKRPEEEDQRNRKSILQKVYSIWITGFLNQSMDHEMRIELGLVDSPEAVVLPFNVEVREMNHNPRALPPGTQIIDVFFQMGNTLLILGSPGSGKTTLLLELARNLLNRAQQDNTHRIPIVLNLSSWAFERKPMALWIMDELNKQYDVPQSIATAWLQADELLFLLDGLDEVSEEYRSDCVRAINAYRRQHGFVPLVVCSRIADYSALATKLRLGGSVVIQPITLQQADDYLARLGPKLATIRSTLTHDFFLQELTRTPLILSIIALTYHDEIFDGQAAFTSVENWQKYLFSKYIHKMLTRRAVQPNYGEQQYFRWLVWLARKMQEHKSTFFTIEELQKTWLASHNQIVGYELVVAVLAMIATCLLFSSLFMIFPPSNPIIGILGIVLPTFGAGFTAWIIAVQEKIKSLDNMQWDWSSFSQGVVIGLRESVVSAVVISGVVGVVSHNIVGAIATFLEALLVSALVDGILRSRIIRKTVNLSTRPNIGMHRSGWVSSKYTIIIAAFGAVIGATVGALADYLGFTNNTLSWLIPILGNNLAAMVLGGAVIGFYLGLFYGALIARVDVVLRHITLRIFMYFSNLAPLNYVKFLNYCDDRIILRRVGGSYIFIHRLLMDYFANLSHYSPNLSSLDHADEEIKAMQRVLLVPFNRAYSHNNLGDALLLKKNLDQAVKHLKERIRLEPETALNANVTLGVISWYHGQAQDAVRYFEGALQVYDKTKNSGVQSRSGLLENRAIALLGLGKIDEAEDTLRECLVSLEFTEDAKLDERRQLLMESNQPPLGIERLVTLFPPK